VTEILHALAPIVDIYSRVLVLGTMPSTISLQTGEYYANPRNQFWPILYKIFGLSLDSQPGRNYVDKIAILQQNGIGVWDVLKECERDGSGDLMIKNGVTNNFVEMLANHPNIKCVFFNGQKANELFSKLNKERSFNDVKFLCLPSTSPANARVPFENKVECWRAIVL
jgi:methylated-DNA-[protein]-cysteine S-methyltransferase